jgi:ribose 5-phosphate isomerase B
MQRAITGYRQDADGAWIAELSCGHTQHVRHDPPWQIREWVLAEDSRHEHLGSPLECRLCDRQGTMRIALASDHAGYRYKSRLAAHLAAQGHEIVDFGTDSTVPVDYPDFVHPAARGVARGDCRLGIVLGGSGNGEAMAANRHDGIRCAVCWNEAVARASADANMIALGERVLPWELALRIVTAWLGREKGEGRSEKGEVRGER